MSKIKKQYEEIIELNCCPDCGDYTGVVNWNDNYSCDYCKNYFKQNMVKYKRIK